VRTMWSSREGSRRVKARGRARHGRSGRHGVAMAPRQPFLASAPWIATRGEAEKLRRGTGAERAGARRGRGSWLGKRRAAGGSARPGGNRGG
jgi:hypothetical protein